LDVEGSGSQGANFNIVGTGLARMCMANRSLRRRKTNLEEQVYSNIGKNKGKCSI
jgi:hypothetical protein